MVKNPTCERCAKFASPCRCRRGLMIDKEYRRRLPMIVGVEEAVDYEVPRHREERRAVCAMTQSMPSETAKNCCFEGGCELDPPTFGIDPVHRGNWSPIVNSQPRRRNAMPARRRHSRRHDRSRARSRQSARSAWKPTDARGGSHAVRPHQSPTFCSDRSDCTMDHPEISQRTALEHRRPPSDFSEPRLWSYRIARLDSWW